VALYPKFQAYFRTHRPPLLAVWGKNDPFFLSQGAEAFRRGNPDAEVHLFDTGHFALETHAPEIARTILKLPQATAGREVRSGLRPIDQEDQTTANKGD
jgi:pimeloyl-ACP methyl ester carboxylesterase